MHRTRITGRWFVSLVVALPTSVAAASCGGGNDGSNFGQPEASTDDVSTGSDDGGQTSFGDGGKTGCKPKTCAELGYNCGKNGDGCGGTIDCGQCSGGEICGAGGYSRCGGGSGQPDGGDGSSMNQCTPATCAGLNVNCGWAGDGCGGALQCGTCTNPEYCGGGGYNKCGGNNGLGADGGSMSCTPATCGSLGYNCGIAADGCGGILNCGTCTNPQFCGGGGFDQCGGNDGLLADGGIPCTPTTCATLGYDCGIVADGCGGVLDCGSCTNPQYCGGGGYSKCGGNNGLNSDGGILCKPETCAGQGYNCGVAGDGCGGTLNCGSCTNPQFCGGGGFNQCGGNNGLNPDGSVICTPETCATLGYTCGITGDGCGGSLDCGTCTNPQFCGGGGFNKCGGNDGLGPDGGVLCTPTTCATLGYNCGQAADGCGGLLNCGTCTNPEFCGGGGYDVCGGNNGLNPDGGVICVPKTCAQLNYDCGAAGDGCGNLLDCGTCTSPQYCGGGGYDVCGPANISVCEGGATTSVTGYVYDPANALPIYDALVYVPLGSVQTPQTGVNPPTCGCTAPPSIASAFTGVDGSFTLNVPADTTISLVVQLGKWQRTFSENITPCKANTLAAHLTLPSTHAQGHIPLFAVDTGNVDTMECVLLKMGIAQSEFMDPAISNGVPTAAGRVHFYQGSIVAGGAVIDNATPKEAALTETASVMDSYDVVLFPCQGGAGTYSGKNWPNTLSNLLNFGDDGGRIFATHYHYDLLHTNGSATTGFEASANWTVNGGSWAGPFTGNVDQSFGRGQALASWLYEAPVNASTTLGQIPVSVIRNDFSSVNAPAQQWVYTTNPPDQGLAHMDIHYTFDTPFTKGGADGTCGRVVYSDFHVENSNGSKGVVFPKECTPGAMTPQEKLLEFMLFDLTSCVSPPTCTPLTCAQQNISCGPAGDGCGNQLNCGSCVSPQTCGGGGVAGQCGYPDGGSCKPETCAQLGINCGPAGDGCGNQLDCGTCISPQTCGGGGTPGQCGSPDGGACVPETCAQQNINCGPAGDGCGSLLSCGTCISPQTCGGGGTPGQCGSPDGGACVPETCAQQNINCGPAGDGCGSLLSCGTCVSPQTCGGGGQPGQCGSPDGGSCKPLTCAQQNIGCGPAGDGCGNQINCGSCPMGQSCGGGGQPGQCGAPDGGACVPLTCAQQNLSCGPAGDGCGNQIDCGTCPNGQACGGGGKAGQCGTPDGGACVPTTCAQQNISCGPASDGCGNLLQCGTCSMGQTCGGGGVQGQCGAPDGGSCKPLTCAQQNISCGPAGDGCGNLIQCGTCVSPQTCGGGGTPGQCGGGTK